MNILAGTKTYLIGCMQYQNGEEWRNDMTEFLNQKNIVVFDPYKKPFINSPKEDQLTQDLMMALMEGRRDDIAPSAQFDIVAAHYKQIRSFDLAMVDKSDFIVCYLNPNVPTYGTVEELVTAVRLKRPIFIVVEGGKSKTPLWVMGMLHHKYIYDDFDQLKKMLTSIDNGEKEADNRRWRLLKPELR